MQKQLCPNLLGLLSVEEKAMQLKFYENLLVLRPYSVRTSPAWSEGTMGFETVNCIQRVYEY